MPISTEAPKYRDGDLRASKSGTRVRLELSEREFNLLREIIREARRLVDPWEMPALLGWTKEELTALEEDLRIFAEEHQIDL